MGEGKGGDKTGTEGKCGGAAKGAEGKCCGEGKCGAASQLSRATPRDADTAICRGGPRAAAGPDGPARGARAGQVDFLEAAPENWIGVGGRSARAFRALAERHPVLLHGLSLRYRRPCAARSGAGARVARFMRAHGCPIYSEHLSYCADDGHLYDLLPIPFTEEAVRHVAARVAPVQDLLGQRIALENASYYAAPAQEMSELEFLRAVLEEADCDLLLDVNNIYVNSINHRYDAREFLAGLPGERAAISTSPGTTSRPRTCASIRMAPR